MSGSFQMEGENTLKDSEVFERLQDTRRGEEEEWVLGARKPERQ